MLDAGIWQEGEAKGVVCLETVGERREWTPDEQQFAASLADIAATVLVHESLRAARASLQETQELFAGALRSSPDPVAVVRLADSRILLVNARFIAVSGYAEDEVVGRTSVELGLWADPSQRDLWVRRLREDGAVREFEVAFIVKGGRRRTFVLSGERLEVRGEQCVVLAAHDVTDRRRQEALVSQIAQGVVEQTGEPFFRSLAGHLARVLGADLAFVGEIHPDDAGRIRTIAVHAGGAPAPDFEYPLAGSPCESILGRGVCAFPDHVAELFPRDRALAEKGIHAYVGARLNDTKGRPLGLMAVLFRHPLGGSAARGEPPAHLRGARLGRTGARPRPARAGAPRAPRPAHGAPQPHPPQAVRGIGACGRAGSRARSCSSTSTASRRSTTRSGIPWATCCCSGWRRRCARGRAGSARACVARLGGDEFAVWIPGAGDARGRGAGRRARAREPHRADRHRGLPAARSARAWASRSPRRTPAPRAACCAAPTSRCTRPSARARATPIYDASQDPYSTERLALLSDLGDGRARRASCACTTSRACGSPTARCGASRRWCAGSTRGWGCSPPSRFVPLAELSDVIRPLTFWVLAESLHQQREWRDRGARPARRGEPVGAPPHRRGLRRAHRARCSRARAWSRRSLELEITESAIIADPERAGATLERIRALGVRVAVDDFGTGFSSLSHLKRLPLNALKIDVSFVRQMLASPADRADRRSRPSTSPTTSASPVVAEGIEDEATLAALRAHGCDEGQGFFIGHPMTAADATAWLDRRRA